MARPNSNTPQGNSGDRTGSGNKNTYGRKDGAPYGSQRKKAGPAASGKAALSKHQAEERKKTDSRSFDRGGANDRYKSDSRSGGYKGDNPRGGDTRGGKDSRSFDRGSDSRGGYNRDSRGGGSGYDRDARGSDYRDNRGGNDYNSRDEGRGDGSSRSTSRRSNNQYLEGKNSVIEALRAEMPLKKIMIAHGTKDESGIKEIVRRAAQIDCPVESVDRRTLDRVSERDNHQGVVAQMGAFPYTPLHDIFKAAEGQENALIIVLDHITDPGNLGAVARSAEVVGALGVVVPSRRSAAITPAAYKASAGALAHIPVSQEVNLARVLKEGKKQGFWIAGASEKASQNLWQAPLSGRVMLVMGSEGEGLARLTQELCDFLVGLPQVGKIDSLNVAQAATVLSYEWLRQVQVAKEAAE